MIDEDVACIEIQEPFLSYEYKGDRDKDEGKSGLGTHIWTFTKVKQKYEGNFFQNTLHGFGDLLIEKQFHYTGYFFANCYEGYGRIKYFNGNIFEGLFKDNKKFGPGVFTYPFGAQDVGFWAGGSLIRLCCNNSVDLIPEITRSYDGKKYIQKFKKAITFQYPPFDEAKDILRKLNVDESDGIAERKDELYNRFLRQKCSLAFDNNKFEKMYFAAPACEDNPMITESSSLSNESAVSWEGDCPLKSLFTKEILLQEIKDQIEIVDVLVYYLQLQKQSIEQDSTENLYVSHEEDEYVDDYGSYNTEYILKNLEELHPWLKDSIENIEIGLQGNGLSTFQKKKFESFEDSLENLERINHLFLLMEQLKLYLTNKYEQLATKKNRERKRTGSSNKENEEFSNSVLEVRSWNNNQWIIDMVAHCHQYKQKEDTLSFDISDFRNRLNFSVCGPHESDCLCFMLQCAFGRTIDIINLCKRSVNPNVSNCKGNSGVFFAVAFDNIKVLKALTELGADLNVYNDECLTPLILSICRLLALMYNINDWEKAFMPSSVSTSPKQQESTNDLNLWHLHSQSEESGNSRFILPPSIEKKIFDNKQTLDRKSVGHQEFILSTECRKVSLKKIKKNKKDKKGSKKGRDKKEKDSKKGKIEKGSKKEKKTPIIISEKKKIGSLEDTETLISMERVKQTLWLLIELGADPDFGTVPLPPLILSIFVKCEMLTKELINRGDSNIRTSVDNLSAIHVLCCLPFHQDYLNIFKVLVPVTNLNLRTGTEHWKKEKEVILSTELYKTVLDEGKTALHILSMRYDFEGFENIQWEMFELLLNEGADPNLSYLGHTSLTLAMLRGNIFIVEEMLKRRFVNPNQLLGEGIGVPLTMLLLKRYTNYLPANLCMRFVNLLMDYNANPFVIFSIHGNAVEFLEKEYESSVTKTKESKRDKSKSRQSKGKDKKKKGVYKVLINNFLICSRNFLLRHIQAKVVEYVYLFISEACTEEKYLFHLAKFVNIDEAVQCLQLLIQNRIIAPRENTLNICRDVLNFVRVCNTDSPRKDNKSSSSLANQPPVETMLTNFNLQKNVYVDKKYNSHPPELDKNLDKYVVCYQCCKSVGKELIPCPNCWMVYFCSEICNKSSLQASGKHKCKLLFYDTEKMRLQKSGNQRSIYYTPLQEKFDWIQEQIRKRKFKKKLEERFAKEWDLINGCTPRVCDKLEFKNAKMKFIKDNLCSFYKNDPDAPPDCIYNNKNN